LEIAREQVQQRNAQSAKKCIVHLGHKNDIFDPENRFCPVVQLPVERNVDQVMGMVSAIGRKHLGGIPKTVDGVTNRAKQQEQEPTPKEKPGGNRFVI
jgi:hypothetical protein